MKVHLTKTEWKILVEFLEELDERFSNAGCNDYKMPNTPENRRFVEKMLKWAHEDDPDGQEETRSAFGWDNDEEELFMFDGMALGFLIHRIKAQISGIK